MRIDGYATLPHYVAHMAPIWFGLGEARHSFYVAGLLADTSNGEGIPGWRIGHPPQAAGLLTMVAGAVDELNCPRPTIYVEHGAGQTYPGDPRAAHHEAYNGTPGHDRTRLFLCPSETVADRWRARYPLAEAVAVGCPRMDAWHRLRPATPAQEGGAAPTVAITFHANNVVCEETRTAWDHYRDRMPQIVGALRRAGWQVLGHGHPRLWTGARGLKAWWESMGVPTADTFDEVLGRADVLAVDNSSAGPEFASLGRPIVWMNAPWYRRQVEHGGRFWTWCEGVETVDHGDQLPDAISRAFSFPPEMREAHERMVRSVYIATDGHATERALEAIMGLDATRVYTPRDGNHAQAVRVPGQPEGPGRRPPAPPAGARPARGPAAPAGSDDAEPVGLLDMVAGLGGRYPAEGGAGDPGADDGRGAGPAGD